MEPRERDPDPRAGATRTLAGNGAWCHEDLVPRELGERQLELEPRECHLENGTWSREDLVPREFEFGGDGCGGDGCAGDGCASWRWSHEDLENASWRWSHENASWCHEDPGECEPALEPRDWDLEP